MIETFDIHNRKYLGSKYRLLDFLEQTILSRGNAIDTFIDGFSGTGVVAHRFGHKARRVIANDILFSNYVVNQAFLGSSPDNTDMRKISEMLHHLNSLGPETGYVSQNFGGSYFTDQNAGLIDAMRETIDDYRESRSCTEQEWCVMLTSLLFAADKVSNTVGQYDAFLKHLGQTSYSSTGRHQVDSNVYGRICLRMPRMNLGINSEVYNEDLNQLVKRIEGDVLYLDPPYNGRQYIDCYHVLENIALWRKPAVFGKTKKFERSGLKSRFSRKSECAGELRKLVLRARVSQIFLSYNSEGFLAEQQIREILEERGEVEIHRQSYPVFGRGAGRSAKREVEERLFHCQIA